jgi:hypothetical protein
LTRPIGPVRALLIVNLELAMFLLPGIISLLGLILVLVVDILLLPRGKGLIMA